MSPLIETLLVINGVIKNADYHQRRMEKSIRDLTGQDTVFNIISLISKTTLPADGMYKCRVVFTDTDARVETDQYVNRPVRSLQMVYDDTIDYGYKYKDRSRLQELYAQRGDCDDVLIIKKGVITDTTFSNIVFKEANRWVTPLDFLLPGTQRQYLLDRNMIHEKVITPADLAGFTHYKLINSMLLFAGPEIAIEQIKI